MLATIWNWLSWIPLGYGLVCLVVGLFAPRTPYGPVQAPRQPPPSSDAAETVLEVVGGLFYLGWLAVVLLVWLSPLLILVYLVVR